MTRTDATHRASDGYVWHYRSYAPPAAPRAHLVCLHGIQSHAGWYEESSAHFAGAGYAVSFLERRGSGANEVARGDTPGFRRLLADIAEFILARRLAEPGVPIVLLAISWGGKLAAAFQRRYPGLCNGLILLCPGFVPLVTLPLRQRLAVLAYRLVRPTTLFPVPLSDPQLFTSNPIRLNYLAEDQRSLRQATARFLVESVRLDGYLRWFPPRLNMPTLLLLAERDRIIDNRKTRLFVERITTGTLQCIEYPGASHTLEFEPAPHRFINDILEWLDRLVKQFDKRQPAT